MKEKQLSAQEIQHIGTLLMSPDATNHTLALTLLEAHQYAIVPLKAALEVFLAFHPEYETLEIYLNDIFPDFYENNPVNVLYWAKMDRTLIRQYPNLVNQFLEKQSTYNDLIEADEKRTIHYADFADILEHFFEDYDNALLYYQKALHYHSDKAWIHYQYANSLVYRRPKKLSLQSATPIIVEGYQTAYRLEPNPKTLYALSLFYKVEVENYAAAKATYLQCLADHPTHTPTLNGYAMLLFELREYHTALKFAQKALHVAEQKNDSSILHHIYDTIAHIYWKGFDATQKALDYFEQAIRYRPSHLESINGAIEILRQEKRFIFLSLWLKKKLAVNKMDLTVLLELADTYYVLEDYDNAKIYYQEALAIFPDYHLAKEGLKKIHHLLS